MAELKAVNRVIMIHNVINTSDICMKDGGGLGLIFVISKSFEDDMNTHIWPSKHIVTS